MEITESEFDVLMTCLYDCTEELNYLSEPSWEWESHSYLEKQKIKRCWPKKVVKENYERNRQLLDRLKYARIDKNIKIIKGER